MNLGGCLELDERIRFIDRTIRMQAKAVGKLLPTEILDIIMGFVSPQGSETVRFIERA